MKNTPLRLFSAALACALLLTAPPFSAQAEEPTSASSSPPAETVDFSLPASESLSPAPAEEERPSDGDVLELRTADDLAAAIAGQEAGQTWHLAEGVYTLTREHLTQYAHWDEPGQGGWYLPLYADGLTIVGDGNVVITTDVDSANGAWATQDFVSVWGDGITIDGVDFQSKSVPNKAIEVMGRDFSLQNCTLLPVVHPDGENGEVFSGSIFFNPQNADGDVGSALLENVYLHAYVSASAARTGTLDVRHVTMDAVNSIWHVWGSGYGPGLVGDVYGQVEDVTYLVDSSAVLEDLLDSSSPYAADTKPGTAIEFAAGTYILSGPLTIGKDLSLTGAGMEQTIFQAAAEPTALLQISGGDVDFSMSGIHLRGVEANSHNNTSGIQVGSNSDPGTGRISIEACRFSGFTKNSITVKGGSAVITGNTIDCRPYPGAAGNGIQIDLGAEAVITGNTIDGYVSQSDSWSACGVLVLRNGKITRIRDNRIANCGIGIVKETYYDADGDRTYLDPDAAKSNTFTNCGQNVDFEFDLAAEIAAASGGVVRLPCDVTLREKLTIPSDLTLDGNGFAIRGQSGAYIEVIGGTFRLSDVTLEDFETASVLHVPADAAPDTQVIAENVHVQNVIRSAYSFNSGSFSISGGSVNGAPGGQSALIQAGSSAGPVSGTVSGVTISGAPDGSAPERIALELRDAADVSVRDCVIRSVRTGILAADTASAVSGGITAVLSGTEVAALENVVWLTGSRISAHIHSGSFGGHLRVDSPAQSGALTITGGRFSADPTEYVAPGYRVSTVGGMYSVGTDAPGGGSGDSTPPAVQPPETSDGSTTVSTQVTPTISGDTAKAEIDTGTMDQAVEQVLEAVSGSHTAPVVQIVVESGSASQVEVHLPVSSLDALGSHESAALTVTSGVATVTLDSTALTAVASQARDTHVVLQVTPVAPEDLSGPQQSAADGAPVFDLYLRSGDTAIPHFGGGSATVTIPYVLPHGQEANGITVYHLDDLGTLSPRKTSYDARAEQVSFTTPHFSRYLIGYRAPASNPFSDVRETDYFYPAVLWAAEQGITLGTAPDTFSPGQVCTRAQAAVLLWRAAGCPKPRQEAAPFRDVSSTDRFHDAVVWAAEQGIILGTAPDVFSPYAPCTRAQIITFLFRYSGDAAGSGRFSDVPPDAYYWSAAAWAAEQGISLGTAPGIFSPDAPCTRAQVITFLFRYLGN